MAQDRSFLFSGLVILLVSVLSLAGIGIGVYSTLPLLGQGNLFLAATYFAMGCLVSIVLYGFLVSPWRKTPFPKAKNSPRDPSREQAEALAMEEAKRWSQELEERAEERTRELDKTSTRLMRTREKLFEAEKLAFLGQLAAGISHQMKNPLGIIKTAAFFVTDASQDPEVREQANIIAKEADRMVEAINGLLRFARQAAASAVGDMDLKAVVLDTLQAVKMSGRLHHIEVNTELDEEIPTLRGDSAQIQQVIMNLLINAVQAMPKAGLLTLRMSRQEANVRLDVSDTGIGIPMDKVEHIWEPFVSDKPDGTGIGLAICKGILERHDVHTNVISQEGMGTTFTLLFPIP